MTSPSGLDTDLRFGAAPVVGADELLDRYGEYRQRQAAALVHMLPREAVRPLYRRARAYAARAPDPVAELDDNDPLALLTWYCERLLPLPPFESWRADFERNPDAHYADVEATAGGPTVDAPATMEARAFKYRGHPWLARLRSFRDAGLWRAHIAFEDVDTGHEHRTATIFCEHDAGTLRERFLGFDSSALEAFLRSALP